MSREIIPSPCLVCKTTTPPPLGVEIVELYAYTAATIFQADRMDINGTGDQVPAAARA